MTSKNYVDPNWTVDNQKTFLTSPNPRWTAVQPPLGASAQWIGPQESSGLNPLPARVYTYNYIFNGGNIKSVSGEFASDNEASILLNGVPLKVGNKINNSFTVLTRFTFRPIKQKTNRLTFVVQNFFGGGSRPSNLNPSATGLYVKFTRIE